MPMTRVEEYAHVIPSDWVPERVPMRMALPPEHIARLEALGYVCKDTWPNQVATGHRWCYITKEPSPPTPLEIFDWAVVRQSDVGPGIATCASAFNCTTDEVRAAVAAWNDPRGTMECVRQGPRSWRIEAYYNTTG